MIEPDAMDPHEIQAVTHHPKDRGLLATRHQPASAAVRPLAMGAWFLMVGMTRARLEQIVTPGSAGAPEDRLRPPDTAAGQYALSYSLIRKPCRRAPENR
jgi:hypothetical protein